MQLSQLQTWQSFSDPCLKRISGCLCCQHGLFSRTHGPDRTYRTAEISHPDALPESTTSEYLHEAFTAHNLKLLPEVELNSNDLLLDLARIGLGIACVPDYMLKENDQLTPLILKDPLPGRQLVLARYDSLTVSQAAERFIEMFANI